MHPIPSAILITWRRNGLYAKRLVADLSPAQWTAQPVPQITLNHAAWVLCHLNVYTPICTAMLLGKPLEDPIDHPFGQKSEVSTNPSAYPAGGGAGGLLAEYERLHAEAEHALTTAAPECFAAATPLERWRTMNPTVGDMLVTLMVKHESGHLGQLSAWRRALGLPRVPM
jgi:hypothetical protein